MFTSDKILKKLIKEAYKLNRLKVARVGDTYYISGTTWKLECEKAFLKKEIKAAIIELAGELPDDGECMEIGKDGIQYDLEIPEIPTPLCYNCEITNIILLSKMGIEQRLVIQKNHIRLINDKYIQILTNDVDLDNGELMVTQAIGTDSGVIYKNNVMRFYAEYRMDFDNDQLISSIETALIAQAWREATQEATQEAADE